MDETTRIATVSEFYGNFRTINTLNEYFSTDRFFFKYGLTRGCFEVYFKGHLEKAEKEKYEFFVKGLMVGINLG